MQVVALLHNIRSIHNVGSIFRSADAAGIYKIYLCGITPKPVDRLNKPRPQFTKVSLGSQDYVEWEYYNDIEPIIGHLKKVGFHIIAIEQDNKSISYDLFKKEKIKKVALVFGNEVDGISQHILELADTVLEIPMHGKKESLNVAVSFGIIAYNLKN